MSIGIFLLFIVVWSACSLLLKAGTIRVISDSYLGHEPELGASLRFGTGADHPAVLVTISKGLLLFILVYGGRARVGLMFFMAA